MLGIQAGDKQTHNNNVKLFKYFFLGYLTQMVLCLHVHHSV